MPTQQHVTATKAMRGLPKGVEDAIAPRTVTQSNELIEASYSLTLNEKRLLLLAATLIDPGKSPKQNASIRITATDFAETFGISAGYEALEQAAVRLYDRSIKSVARTRRGVPVEERRWLTGRAVYDEGAVQLEFNEGILDYMTLLSEQFTTYPLQQISQLSSFYTIRIYELAVAAQPAGELYLELQRLREILDLGSKYPSVKDLRRYVIDPAVEQITSTSPWKMRAEPVREGRKVIGFKLFAEKQQQRNVVLASAM
ncbi:Replication initiation protein (plasmid) [Xanthomonas hydrangeae]|uniref:replication initiation protein n=1 Tax=Xanthomonas hydrangeae TaxID=2775159 RepID=UPI001966C4F7|nr:Replication initiation protein [Xanthomonas hydrangeae]CAD7740936.1 Replication initiation protein [Xanthomonas hydrangeae]CAD7748006.1 Replication initiation protein [Xanthomonas hydrangeae]CAD7748007.1 Replication initiation protein [Xanthomonas hydrangeae]CAD7748116.1 Replication initiation protein [Xanthomonas hydrangeae]